MYWNDPGPKSTYDPGLHALIAFWMLLKSVVALPDGASVAPHCTRVGGVQAFGTVSVQFVSDPLHAVPPLPYVNVLGNPARDQSVARLVARMPDHGWP